MRKTSTLVALGILLAGCARPQVKDPDARRPRNEHAHPSSPTHADATAQEGVSPEKPTARDEGGAAQAPLAGFPESSAGFRLDMTEDEAKQACVAAKGNFNDTGAYADDRLCSAAPVNPFEVPTTVRLRFCRDDVLRVCMIILNLEQPSAEFQALTRQRMIEKYGRGHVLDDSRAPRYAVGGSYLAWSWTNDEGSIEHRITLRSMSVSAKEGWIGGMTIIEYLGQEGLALEAALDAKRGANF